MILVFAEDPGAINYLLLFVKYLHSNYIKFLLLGAGCALEDINLQSLGIRSFDTNSIKKLEASGITAVMVGTSENRDSLSFKLTTWASINRISSYAIIDSSANANQRFSGNSQNPLEYSPDFLFVPDQFTFDLFISYGFQKKNIFIIGSPDPQQKLHNNDSANTCQVCNTIRMIAGQRKIITFISELSTGLNESQYKYSPDYTISGTSGSLKRTTIVIEELLHCLEVIKNKTGWDPYLILRLHPKENSHDHHQYLDRFNTLSIHEDPLKIILESDFIIGMSSMLLYEGFLMNKQCLSILPRDQEKDWLPIIRNQNIYCAQTRIQILEILNKIALGKSIYAKEENTLFFDPSLLYSILLQTHRHNQS